jgi:hypothetical protein
MKVVIFTMQPALSIPPRIRMEKQILEAAGYEVEICGAPYQKQKMPAFFKLLYYLTLSYFRWDLIHLYKANAKKGDIAIVYDLSLLPLLKNLRKSYQRIIYETLDNNVALTFFHLSQRFVWLQPFSGFIKNYIGNLEKQYIRKYTDHLIVNSQYLEEILGNLVNTTVNIYASPFEQYSVSRPISMGQNPAFLYLGIFSTDKGAETVLELQKQYALPLFIFGDKKYNVPDDLLIKWKDRMPLDQLYEELRAIFKEYRLIGISLIKSNNESYANQEANKEADYLSLGIPFIGNKRRTTEEKILGGCGCFIHESDKIKLLIEDSNHYTTTSENAKKYYHANLSAERFSQQLLHAIQQP